MALGLASPSTSSSGDKVPGLTAEALAMPRSAIALEDHMLRLFNGRGAFSVRDHTVTGLQAVQFTPFDQRHWHFHAALREMSSNLVMDDAGADVWDYYARTGRGSHPLGLNGGSSPSASSYDPARGEVPHVLVLQDCTWQPNKVTRTGTFHKLVGDRWLSVGLTSVARADAARDIAHLQLDVKNRTGEVLNFVVLGRQRVANPADPNPATSDLGLHPEARAMVVPVLQAPGGTQLGCEQFEAVIVCDQPALEDGWALSVPPGATATAHLAVYFLPAGAARPGPTCPWLGALAAEADAALSRRLAHASSALPQVRTPYPGLDDLYNRCALSVLDSRWERPDWPLTPFYAAGEWTFTLAWDISFASALVALLDPEGLRLAIAAYFKAGLLRHSYVGFEGTLGHSYTYTVFSALWVVRDYLEVTGDMGFLDETAPTGRSNLEEMHSSIKEVLERYTAEDGLVDFGEKTIHYLETRTDGYQYRVAIAYLMLVDALAWFAELARARGDAADEWAEAASDLKSTVDRRLWDEDKAWFANGFPDGSRQMVWSYQLFDALRGHSLTPAQKQALAGHIHEGTFLGPHGMYSIARTDRLHWDLDDVDWGGGGQYTGMPLRTAKSLWRMGEAARAWDIVSRCTTWARTFPYIPQEIYADRLASPVVEQSVIIAAGGGCQAVIFGLFGIRPQMDGSLQVEPTWQPGFVGADLTGYRHHGKAYDVALGADGFSVRCDGREAGRSPYGQVLRYAPSERPAGGPSAGPSPATPGAHTTAGQ
jgi:hypothetical protein